MTRARDLADSADKDIAGTLTLDAVNASGVITGLTVEATGDTAAGDNAAMGYTAAEGLILTGQGSTNDVTIKNDADADVIEIPTGTVNVTMAGTLGVTGAVTANAGVVVDNFTLDGTSLSLSSGVMTLNAADVRIKNVANNETMAQFDDDGAVNLYNNNELSLSTVAGGSVSIYNDLSLTSDGGIINIGVDNDLKISHSGSAATINNNTGDLSIQTDGNLKLERKDGGEDFIHCIADGAVELHHNGIKKFETLAEGSQSTNSHSSTTLTDMSSNSTFKLMNASVGNGIYNALEFAGNQQSMFISAINHGTIGSRKLSFYIGSVGGDAASDNKLDMLDSGVDFNPAAGNKDFRVRSDDNDNMLFVNAGDNYVGVGTSAPASDLNVHNPTTTCALIVSGQGNANRKAVLEYNATDGPIIRAGSSGITSLKFTVDNSTLAGKFDTNADFYTNDGTVHSLSDIRVKTDVEDLTDGLDIVRQLKPRTFRYTEDSEFYNEKTKDEIKHGFVANEVETVAPQYTDIGKGRIGGEEVDDLRSLSTTKMIPMLVKAIQELSAKNDALEARLETLEG